MLQEASSNHEGEETNDGSHGKPDDDSHGVALFANHDDLFPYVWQFLQHHEATP